MRSSPARTPPRVPCPAWTATLSRCSTGARSSTTGPTAPGTCGPAASSPPSTPDRRLAESSGTTSSPSLVRRLMPTVPVPVRRLAASTLFFAALIAAPPARAATLPTLFSESLVASGLARPTAMQFAPDGRLFVCQQGGALRVIKDGALLPTPFVTHSGEHAGGARPARRGLRPELRRQSVRLRLLHRTSTAPLHNRVSRFTANGDVALAGSEVVIVDLDPLRRHQPQRRRHPLRGRRQALRRGRRQRRRRATRSRCPTGSARCCGSTPTASIPADNPTAFAGIAGAPAGANRAIWAVGLRNPFTFALNSPAPGRRCSSTTWARAPGRRSTTACPAPTTAGPTSRASTSNPGAFPNFTRPYTPTTTAAVAGAPSPAGRSTTRRPWSSRASTRRLLLRRQLCRLHPAARPLDRQRHRLCDGGVRAG